MSENMRTYETICLTKVDMPEDKFTGMIDKIKSAVTNEGSGEVLMQDDWGKAKIAYPIDREPRAQWTYFRYSSTPKAVESIGHQLRINEFVLRQMTIKVDPESTDYATLRPNMQKELGDRFNRFDDRPRRKGPRRDMKNRSDRYGGGDDNYSGGRSDRNYGEDTYAAGSRPPDRGNNDDRGRGDSKTEGES
ncbi:30S ribosomal protein S6 [bacterium]|nr:30S ribosomal protein S6 [bacterium]